MCGSKASKIVKQVMGGEEKKDRSQNSPRASAVDAQAESREEARAKALAEEQAQNEQGSASTIITGKNTTIDPVEPEKKTLLG